MATTQVDVGTPSNLTLYSDTNMSATADAVKNSSATVYWVQADNTASGSASYVKLYNTASGSVAVGTTVPDEVIYVPAGALITQQMSTGAAPGKTFGTALTACCVTTGGTGGTTSPGPAHVTVTIAYV